MLFVQQTKNVLSVYLLIFLAIAVTLVLVDTFHREGDLPRKSPTEYEKTPHSESQSSSNGESRIRKANVEAKETASKFVRAWNQGNSKEIAELFTADAILTMPNGSEIQSKSEIEKEITEKRDGLLSETTLSNAVDEVSQIDVNTAVVKGRYQVTGIKILGLSTEATGTFILRQLNREGKWLISKAEIRNGDGG
jgi:uncharacterized protein (TIGR02246 family)